MPTEDQDEFIDRVAQAVIDKIEERQRVEGIVTLVVSRVMAMQAEQRQADAVLNGITTGNGLQKEEPHAAE